MSPILRCWGVRLGLAGVVVGGAIAFGSAALAQVVPDNTLGSVVNTDGNVQTITGGTTRDTNLFHSFEQFSILDGRTASFANETNIRNIITRVTGGSISNIEGRLKANDTANLFLLNPNGIVFGRNAQLDIGGSFVASTANAIQFGEQGFFSATDPNAPPLLTVNPSAFLFNQTRVAAIENNSIADAGSDPAGNSGYFGLRVPNNKSLLLVGGDLKADGGGIVAFGGRVDLATVAGMGTVGLNVNGDKLSLSVPNSLPRADVSLTNGAGFIVAGNGGGDIAITAKNIEILSESGLFAGILSNYSGAQDAQAGNITLNATETVAINNSWILNSVLFDDAVGNAGNINISTGSLSVTNAGQIRSQTLGIGDAGNITIEARDSVSFKGRDDTDSIPSAAFTSVESGATGNAGNIYIKTGSLSISDRAQLLSNTESNGDAGNITIEARDHVSLFNSILISEVSEEGGIGNGGDINIKTGTLLLKNGSALLTDLENQGERAGDIKIEARDAVILEGRGPGARSGSLQRDVPSQITATVDPRAVEVDTEGRGGNISISTGTLLVTDGGFISTGSFGSGDAGNILLQASKSIRLREGSLISTSAGGAGQGGNGGNITIDSPLVIAGQGELEGNNDIFANAFNGSGGQIEINAQSIIGLTRIDGETLQSLLGTDIPTAEDFERILNELERSDSNDVAAFSIANPSLSGTVNFNAADVELSRDIVELPTTPVDASTLIASGCPSGAENRFVVAGRGGLPPAPGDKLSADALLTDWATLTTPETQNRAVVETTTPEAVNTTIAPLVEATTWQFGSKGEIILTSADPATPNSFEATPSNCPSS